MFRAWRVSVAAVALVCCFGVAYMSVKNAENHGAGAYFGVLVALVLAAVAVMWAFDSKDDVMERKAAEQRRTAYQRQQRQEAATLMKADNAAARWRSACKHLSSTVTDVQLVVTPDGLAMHTLLPRSRALIGWEQVAAVHVESPTHLRRRTTATRLVGLGLLSLATSVKESYLVVEIHGGGESIFRFDKSSEHDLRAVLSGVLAGLPKAPALSAKPASRDDETVPKPPPSSALGHRLRELRDLLAEGLIDQAEHDRLRQAALEGA